MTAGVNASSTIGLGALALYSQQLSIPPASASIGGTYGISLAIPISPLIGPVVHGINAALIPLAGANIEEYPWPTIEVTVVPEPSTTDLRAKYDDLRRKMVSEGIPLLDAAELACEIAERKGSRF